MTGPDPKQVAAAESMAVELATLADSEIALTLGRVVDVRYKSLPGEADGLRNPVSEVDERVEQVIRPRLGARFPQHGIIGEEMGTALSAGRWCWAIDPVDGTTNFVNGLPLVASSVGVLREGRPIAGAIWCGATHALAPWVYHGRVGASLRFDGTELALKRYPQVKQRLGGSPRAGRSMSLEQRKTGSAALECALVAAGILAAARFDAPHVWDVAGGLALMAAAGGNALVKANGRWEPFKEFAQGNRVDELSAWRRPVIISHPIAGRHEIDELKQG